MGGAERLLAQAREAFAAGDYRWVAELVGHLVFADPANLEARALQADAFALNLTRTAFPANAGFDWLRPAVDAATAVPLGDALAPGASYLQFRDPVLQNIAKTTTVTSANGASPAVQVFDPSANLAAAAQGRYVPSGTYSMAKVNLPHVPLFELISVKATESKLAGFKPQEIANLVWAMSVCRLTRAELIVETLLGLVP